MIWLTWRQHRVAVLSTAAVFLGLAAWFLLIGSGTRGSLAPAELSYCIGLRFDCGEWQSSLMWLRDLEQTLLPLLPALIGVFLGAPLLSREIEQRTFRYTWTQGITRGHWLKSKVLLLGAAIVLLSTAFSGAYMWLYDPAVPEQGWFDAFNQALPVFPAMCLSGFALGVAAGALTRKLLVSMALAFGAFLAVFLPIVIWIRATYQAPLSIPADAYAAEGRKGWAVDFSFRDGSGTTYDIWEASRQAGMDVSGGFGSKDIEQLNRAGFTEYVSFQPADRFWTFQLIETGIYLWLTAGCIALAYWLLRRKAL
ncbi:ABC transporter permease [Saccharopolyspora indica]|uniref:ABC transporter permease n=1 Tax=Saccharopolyspora indica TaxID=1229659 RepID=UPI0022EB9716|nr:ABC transporter permease [Saccharopolyspora indica]MDA3644838.1 ABC transporter permease [Saccharopolyspora indica]